LDQDQDSKASFIHIPPLRSYMSASYAKDMKMGGVPHKNIFIENKVIICIAADPNP
jgi:hypothetical protein